MKLEIDRSQWLRGEGAARSYLLRRADQKMCCLGFYLRSCGLGADLIEGECYPSDLGNALPEKALWLGKTPPGTGAKTWSSFLASTNDDQFILASEREERIVQGFAEQGIEVSFVDDGSPTSSPAEPEKTKIAPINKTLERMSSPSEGSASATERQSPGKEEP